MDSKIRANFLRSIADKPDALKDASRLLPKMFWAADDEACYLNSVKVTERKVVAEICHYYCDQVVYDEEGNPEEVYGFWIETFVF